VAAQKNIRVPGNEIDLIGGFAITAEYSSKLNNK
jgi:hypothetical protein